VHGVGFAERDGGDLRVEALAERRDHLVGSFEDAERRRQRPPGRVLERLARRECRLLADDAWTADLVDVPRAVGDDPVAREQLDGLGAFVDDRDRIEEEPLVARRLGSFRRVSREDLHANAPRRGFRCKHTASS
jgi:hypothetical protein